MHGDCRLLLSPSGWPVYADSGDEYTDLTGRGYSVLPADQVQAAVDAFRAAEASPPATQFAGWALATDVQAALATKANAASLGLKQDKATLGADVAADPAVKAAYQRCAGSEPARLLLRPGLHAKPLGSLLDGAVGPAIRRYGDDERFRLDLLHIAHGLSVQLKEDHRRNPCGALVAVLEALRARDAMK